MALLPALPRSVHTGRRDGKRFYRNLAPLPSATGATVEDRASNDFLFLSDKAKLALNKFLLNKQYLALTYTRKHRLCATTKAA